MIVLLCEVAIFAGFEGVGGGLVPHRDACDSIFLLSVASVNVSCFVFIPN